MTKLPTISAASDLIRRGELTPLDLVERCLARIEECENDIRAWVLVDAEGARRDAESLMQRGKSGEVAGPLHGIPIGVKDIIDVTGMPTRAASPLREDISPANSDAPIVAALRKAGAIILGKTVTTEWACFDPPPTRNPWNLDRTPGGSSSGSAAAVAMGMCMAALGTQTGGSIIRPAAYCGVCGLKPTFGSLPMDGILPVSLHLDHVGPIARCAEDLQIVHTAIKGRASGGSFGIAAGCRLDEFFFDRTDADVRQVFDAALAKLSEARWTEAPCLPDSFTELHAHHWTIMAVDAAQVHRKTFKKSPESFGPKVAALIDEGLSTSGMAYASALQHQHDFRTELQHALGAGPLVLPATPTTAPGPETTGDATFNAPWSYCGWPAVTIPCGLDANGLPVGLQIVGGHGCENELLSAAAWCEKHLEPLSYGGLPKPSS